MLGAGSVNQISIAMYSVLYYGKRYLLFFPAGLNTVFVRLGRGSSGSNANDLVRGGTEGVGCLKDTKVVQFSPTFVFW